MLNKQEEILDNARSYYKNNIQVPNECSRYRLEK